MQNDDSKRMNNVVYEREMSVGYSENTHLIEQSAYKYSLQERADPNLYRPLFDYDSVPKVSFNHRFCAREYAGEDSYHRHHVPRRVSRL